MRTKDWNSIEEKIKQGIYKMVRLVKVTETETIVSIPYNKVTHSPAERLKYIRASVDRLPPGNYLLQCRNSATNNDLIDDYKISVKPKTLVLPNSPEEKATVMPNNNEIDFDEYIEAIKENERLKAEKMYLLNELEFYKKEYYALREIGIKQPTLNDSSEVLNQNGKSNMEIVASAISDGIASLIPVVDRHYTMQEKKLELEGKKLETGQVKKIKMKSIEERAAELAEELQELEESNPVEFEKRLDELEEKNPKLYNMVCDILGIEEYEEEEEEEEE